MIDVIIATYNRLQYAQNLAEKLLLSTQAINNIILVNSESMNSEIIYKEKGIILINTHHQNQPYQRFLGYKASSAPWLLFLDDDMELLDSKIFNDILQIMQYPDIVAINLPFENHNNFLAEQPRGIVSSNSKLRSMIGSLSGYPSAKPNQYLHNSIRGPRTNGQPIEYLSGGAFVVRKAVMYKNFNMQLFSIYESKLGKGEDGILGYTLSKQGKIYTYPDRCFVHNDFKDSSYSSSQEAFAIRVLYSRLYLSCEYYRLNQKPIILGYIRFWHYVFGRLFGAILSLIISPSKSKVLILKGNIKALIKSFSFQFDSETKLNFYWHHEAENKLNS